MNIGLLFRLRRIDKKLNLQEAALALRLEPHVIQTLEGPWTPEMSADPMFIGWVVAYACWLDLDPVWILRQAHKQKRSSPPPWPEDHQPVLRPSALTAMVSLAAAASLWTWWHY